MPNSSRFNSNALGVFLVISVAFYSSINAEEEQIFDRVPDFRTANDCGRIAVFNFANIIGNATIQEVCEGVPIHGVQGSSLEEMSKCLSRLGIRNEMRWLKPNNLSKLTFPTIVRMKNLNDQFHYLVLVQYLEDKDKFGVLDGERDEIVYVEGKKIRLRSTGFAIVPKPDASLSIYSAGWFVILALAGANLLWDRQS